MKKAILFFTAITSVLGAGWAGYSNGSIPQTNVIESHADYYIYKDAAELAKDSELIVEAKFNGTRKTINFKHNNTIIDSATKSSIEVVRLFKGDVGPGSVINVYEPGYYHDQKTYVPKEGYNLMNKEGRYILFLKKNNVDGTYVVVGGFQGKYDKNIAGAGDIRSVQRADYLGEDTHFLKLKEQVSQQFN
ncbi:hypothetical protein [Paenibacillus sp. GCM10012303]|uniref:hypothetical protein n=1 Tax=Paenibacillus sp. GCM10012303 TaxID=3317340 RepID=UPI00360FEE42